MELFSQCPAVWRVFIFPSIQFRAQTPLGMEGGEHSGMGGGLGFCHAIFSPTAARTAGVPDACELARCVLAETPPRLIVSDHAGLY